MGGRVVGLARVVAATPDAFPPDKSGIIYASAHQASALLERLDELRSAEMARIESLVEGLQDGIILIDRGMEIVHANSVARTLLASLLGRSDLTGVRLEETPLAELVSRALESKEAGSRQEFSFGEESQRYLLVTAAPLPDTGAGEGVVLVLRDVTEERLMQESLLQSEKMASVGQLVSGVAHELNNPLTGVTGFAQLLLTRDLDEQTRRDVQTIYSEAERAAKIVQNLLSFARRRKAQKGLVNLNTLLAASAGAAQLRPARQEHRTGARPRPAPAADDGRPRPDPAGLLQHHHQRRARHAERPRQGQAEGALAGGQRLRPPLLSPTTASAFPPRTCAASSTPSSLPRKAARARVSA